ncbi:hypothetical protein L484_009036 [Morus notabilis]|uniref:Uncharacterized protein n=1 Tax=Morus notabilis TaxID=981085 RepID=W9RZW4_9ROSA|nr:hypothetical protein L484_009036 [Morus notabilis]
MFMLFSLGSEPGSVAGREELSNADLGPERRMEGLRKVWSVRWKDQGGAVRALRCVDGWSRVDGASRWLALRDLVLVDRSGACILDLYLLLFLC